MFNGFFNISEEEVSKFLKRSDNGNDKLASQWVFTCSKLLIRTVE